jgi:hypothetical protein
LPDDDDVMSTIETPLPSESQHKFLNKKSSKEYFIDNFPRITPYENNKNFDSRVNTPNPRPDIKNSSTSPIEVPHKTRNTQTDTIRPPTIYEHSPSPTLPLSPIERHQQLPQRVIPFYQKKRSPPIPTHRFDKRSPSPIYENQTNIKHYDKKKTPEVQSRVKKNSEFVTSQYLSPSPQQQPQLQQQQNYQKQTTSQRTQTERKDSPILNNTSTSPIEKYVSNSFTSPMPNPTKTQTIQTDTEYIPIPKPPVTQYTQKDKIQVPNLKNTASSPIKQLQQQQVNKPFTVNSKTSPIPIQQTKRSTQTDSIKPEPTNNNNRSFVDKDKSINNSIPNNNKNQANINKLNAAQNQAINKPNPTLNQKPNQNKKISNDLGNYKPLSPKKQTEVSFKFNVSPLLQCGFFNSSSFFCFIFIYFLLMMKISIN